MRILVKDIIDQGQDRMIHFVLSQFPAGVSQTWNHLATKAPEKVIPPPPNPPPKNPLPPEEVCGGLGSSIV